MAPGGARIKLVPHPAHRPTDRLVEADETLRRQTHELVEVVLAPHDLVHEAADEGLGHGGVDRRDEPDPCLLYTSDAAAE